MWLKGKEMKLETERERIDLDKIKVEMRVKLKSANKDVNTKDTVVRIYCNIMELPKLKLKKFDDNILK